MRSSQEVSKFIATALKRWQQASEAESEWRKLALEDLKFSVGEQWPDEILQRRQKGNRPCLTLNRLPQFIKQVTNNQRQQRPQAQVSPAGDGASKDVADVFQGGIRHVEQLSDAEIAYDIAGDFMARIGKGFWRYRTEYIDDDGNSLDQEIVIDAIHNPFTVYLDPKYSKPDKSDRKYGFIIEDLTHDEYKAQYPKSEVASLSEISSIGDTAPGWADSKNIRVAEYYYIEYEQVKGSERTFNKPVLNWAKINALEILEERDVPGKIVPIVEITGDDLIVDGKRHVAGMVRDAKDPARMYNYWNSAATEAVALAPKAPFIGWKGQFTDPKWEYANLENYAFLEADVITVEGGPAPSLPQRNVVEPPIMAMTRMIAQSDNDIKSTIGLYDASLGEKGPEQSGKAIQERKLQGDMATANYSDNIARGHRLGARILIEMFPKVYDAARMLRIIHPDQSIEHVGIYNSQSDAMKGIQDPKTLKLFEGVKKIYDIGVGRYDVTVIIGPSYPTRRREAVGTQLELMKNVPLVAQVASDVVVRNMDIPDAEVIADRLKKALPPQFQDDSDSSPEAQLQKAQSQLAQMTQQHEMLAHVVEQQTEEIRTKKVEQDTKIAIAKIDAFRAITVAEINTKAQNQTVRAQLESDEFQAIHDGAHEVGLEAMKHAHTLEQQQQGHEQALEQGDQAGQQQQIMAQNQQQEAQ